MKKLLFLALLLVIGIGLPVMAQSTCGSALAPRLAAGQSGQVSFTDGQPLNVRNSAGLTGTVVGQLPEGTGFTVLEGPVCADNIYWWRIQAASITGWVAEGTGGVYFIEPASLEPTAAPIAPSPTPGVFTTWDWKHFLGDNYTSASIDPMTITPPATYAGDMPALPVDLGSVLFVADAQLDANQTALLAQNGFVVVPAGLKQFSDAYSFSDEWNPMPVNYDYNADPSTLDLGHPYFVTTDAMLHALHYIFDNLLTDLERETLINRVLSAVSGSLEAAIAQSQQAVGTPLEIPARNATLYLAVAAKLLLPGDGETISDETVLGQVQRLRQMVAGLDRVLSGEADTIVSQAIAGSGQIDLSFLDNYREDFSQYRPRGHYADNPILERYFRSMMWLSRITFRANDDAETLTALLLLRALQTGPDAYANWQTVHDTLTFLIGPVDDLGPPEYGRLAAEVFGADLSLANLADTGRLANFRAQVAELPGPRINGLILPNSTQAEDVAKLSRGFRFMGQRFTLDAYVLQQLIYPYVGTPESPRPLPLGLDVPSAVGSDVAYQLAAKAGATVFAKYDSQMAALRAQISALTTENWMENTYSGWLWSLKPLWVRDAALYPPLMQTPAWLRKDLQTGLASWAELKHDTVLYAKQATGFGGGGPPLAAYGYVEPNPLVFARIAIVAATTYQGLADRDLIKQGDYQSSLFTSANELYKIVFTARDFALMARKELAGETLTEDEYFEIELFGTSLDVLLRTLYQGSGQPDPVALVTDVASNPSTQSVLQEGVGGVDYIYVVVPSPRGPLQLARGGVFSYYEFIGNINQRMTDAEWRAQVESGTLPPRPDWISAFFSQ